MNTYVTSLVVVLYLFYGGSAYAQPGNPTGGSTPDGSSGADPIAVVAAHILKGQTNNEQRKAIRLEWLTLAAQQAEDLLRTSAFQRIIEFVQKNHDLFEDIYAEMKRANSILASGKRVSRVVSLQRDLLIQFTKTARIIENTEHFTGDELRVFHITLDGMIEDTEDNFLLLKALFLSTTDANFTDMERYEVLETIENRLIKNVGAVNQLNRYINYLDTNRGIQYDRGMKTFIETN